MSQLVSSVRTDPTHPHQEPTPTSSHPGRGEEHAISGWVEDEESNGSVPPVGLQSWQSSRLDSVTTVIGLSTVAWRFLIGPTLDGTATHASAGASSIAGGIFGCGALAIGLIIWLRQGGFAESSGAEAQALTTSYKSSIRMFAPYAVTLALLSLSVVDLVHRQSTHSAAGVYVGTVLTVAMVLVRQILTIVGLKKLPSPSTIQSTSKGNPAVDCDTGTGPQTPASARRSDRSDYAIGLANRITFEERLRAELDHVNNGLGRCSLLLVNIDRLRAYNDEFGMTAGDEVIEAVGRVMLQSVRPTDLAARYAGAQFALILSGADMRGAHIVADRIRTKIDGCQFPNRPVTVSIGIARLAQGENRGPKEWMEEAETSLIHAEPNGCD